MWDDGKEISMGGRNCPSGKPNPNNTSTRVQILGLRLNVSVLKVV